MALKPLRERIDSIDHQILRLLEERAELVHKIGEAKREANLKVYDPQRERVIIDKLLAASSGVFPKEAISRVFREVMSACLMLQEPISVAFLGPEGTFTHMASRCLFGLAVRYVESPSIEGVFDAVRSGAVKYGVVPIENSTEGSVSNSLDALLHGGVKIRHEIVLPVHHALLSRVSQFSEIRRVYSHPQALAQCRNWLTRNLGNIQLVQTPSTSAAVHAVQSDEEGAAIASPLAGELLSVPALRTGIQDRPENATRFVMLAQEDAPVSGDDKTMLAFSINDEQGALKRILEVFEQVGINLTRIESRPNPEKVWQYVFLVDVQSHWTHPGFEQATAELKKMCDMVTVLGSFPRWQG
jgi:chorismate mutase / prephenate dehydratase